MKDTFTPNLMSRHAVKEAQREKIPLEMIKLTYEDPDEVILTDDDELREIRIRWFSERGLAVVVDVYDGRIVTIWRKGEKE